MAYSSNDKNAIESADHGASAMRYTQLERFREPFLRRARQGSELTLPYLIPPEGWTGESDLRTPYQGIGARGVNNLGSKLLLTLFPTNSPFFRYKVDEFMVEQMQESANIKTKIETGLAKMERAIVDEIETTAMRVPAFEGIKHLIVGGNALLYLPPTGGMRVFHLSRYVCKRDPMGNVLEIITKEDIAPSALPTALREMVYATDDKKVSPSGDEKTCALYTHVIRRDGSWRVHQEIKGKIIPDSRGSYPLDKSPWMACRWNRIDGEDYGRGYVEDYLGDLQSLEGLAQAIVEGSAAAAKLLVFVNPNGTTRKKDVSDAPNGAVVAGNAEDVTLLRLDKFNDFRVTADSAAKIEQRLAMAFLLNSAIQREGERVTAEEIRVMAKDLEDALGGIYSILSQDVQLPVVTRLQHQMQRQGRLPRLPKGVVRPSIVTGLEALGRGNDLNKLNQLAATLNQALGPQATAGILHGNEFADRIATALGIDTKGLIKTMEEMQAEQQAAQKQALMQQFGPEIVKQSGAMVQEQMKQGADPATVQEKAQEAMQNMQAQTQ